MATEMILVVGATGLLGEPVARQLLQDGFKVRALVRDVERAQTRLGPDFEYIVGDVDDAVALERALDNCMGVHVSLNSGPKPEDHERVQHQGTAHIAELAARQNLARLTYLSGELVAEEHTQNFPSHLAKFRAEQAIQRSGVPYTIFKPAYFMDTLPRHIQGNRAIALGRPGPLYMIAASDFARMVSRAFRTPEASNRQLFVHGPEAIRIVDALRLYCSLVEPDKKVITMPLWFMFIIDKLFLHGRMRDTLQIMQLLERFGDVGDPSETNQLLGAPMTTLYQWCEQQRARQLASTIHPTS